MTYQTSKKNWFIVFSMGMVYVLFLNFYMIMLSIYMKPTKSAIVYMDRLGEANIEIIIFTLIGIAGFIAILMVAFEQFPPLVYSKKEVVIFLLLVVVYIWFLVFIANHVIALIVLE